MDWSLIAVVWLTFAILCGFLAPLKGRSSGEWFFFGLIFGIFALAGLALIERREPSALRICANCGKTVDPSRKSLCQNCGLPFAAS